MACHDSSAFVGKSNDMLIQKQRWKFMETLVRKEKMFLAELICLTPNSNVNFDRVILDSIVLDIDFKQDEEASTHSTQILNNQTARSSINSNHNWKPWKKSSVSPSDYPDRSSDWFDLWKTSRSLWLPYSGTALQVTPQMIQNIFGNQNGFLGSLGSSDRPYTLLIFDKPENAYNTYQAFHGKEIQGFTRLILLDFCHPVLPAFFNKLHEQSFGQKYSSFGVVPSSDVDALLKHDQRLCSRTERGIILDEPRDIPGLIVIPNFISEEEEEHLRKILLDGEPEMEELIGANFEPKFGQWVNLTLRRVQHHGFAFNYLTKNIDTSKFMGPLPSWVDFLVERINFKLNETEHQDTLKHLFKHDDNEQKEELSHTSSSFIDHRSYMIPNESIFDIERKIWQNSLKEERNSKVNIGENHNHIDEKLKSNDLITWNPDQMTVNEYLPGQGIPFHIDTHAAFDGNVISISILGDTIMEFTHPDGAKGRRNVHFPKRCLFVLTGEARYLWAHGITPRTTDSLNGRQVPREKRISITLRTVRRDAIKNPCVCKFPPQCEKWRNPPIGHTSPLVPSPIESLHVHQVYDVIANHFDKTRYKPWPRVVEWLKNLTIDLNITNGVSRSEMMNHASTLSMSECSAIKFPLIADVGCGNGRYLGNVFDSNHPSTEDVSNHMFRIGGDRCKGLVEICKTKGFEVSVFDCLEIPFRNNAFDASMSIAVMHHLSTLAHRVQAMKELIRIVKVGGQIMVYVRALESSGNEDPDDPQSNTPSSSNRSFGQQDVFIPWYLSSTHNSSTDENGILISTSSDVQSNQTVFMRYHHVFRKKELLEIVDFINREYATKGEGEFKLDVASLAHTSGLASPTVTSSSPQHNQSKTYVSVLEDGMDHGNCYIILQRNL